MLCSQYKCLCDDTNYITCLAGHAELSGEFYLTLEKIYSMLKTKSCNVYGAKKWKLDLDGSGSRDHQWLSGKEQNSRQFISLVNKLHHTLADHILCITNASNRALLYSLIQLFTCNKFSSINIRLLQMVIKLNCFHLIFICCLRY